MEIIYERYLWNKMAKSSENFLRNSTELVIPGGTNESKAYRLEANALGKHVIGASCIQNDPDKSFYDKWIYIPSIHDAGFEENLLQNISREHITSIFCPHIVLYKVISKILEAHNLSVSFVNPPPGEIETIKVTSLYESATKVRDLAVALNTDYCQEIPDLAEIAGLLFYTRMIPGMTSEEKLAAFLAIYPELPKGDIVEIGAYRGRSTYMLSWGSRRYQIGKVLVLDPWSPILAQQNNSPDIVRDEDQTLIKDLASFWETTFEGFLAALSPFRGVMNYLRLPSVEAVKIYTRKQKIQSPTFGTTKYTGQISLIHIDGNHDYEMVNEDCNSWLPFIMPGGWIVFDDYLWLHGDGPQKVGDDFLQNNSNKIERAFCFDKSLFIKMKI